MIMKHHSKLCDIYYFCNDLNVFIFCDTVILTIRNGSQGSTSHQKHVKIKVWNNTSNLEEFSHPSVMNYQQVSSVECLQRQDWSIEKAMLKNSCNFWMTHTRLNIYILKYYLTRISSALSALSFNFYFIFFIFFTFFLFKCTMCTFILG